MNCSKTSYDKGTLLLFPGPLTHSLKLEPLEKGEQYFLSSRFAYGVKNCFMIKGQYECIGFDKE